MSVCTLRILSLDGGGERGYLSTIWLKRFIAQWGIAPGDLWKYFDVIAGTSIGGIAALGYAFGVEPDVLVEFFTEKGPRIFTIRTVFPPEIGCTAGTDSNTPNNGQKLYAILTNDPFYKSPASCNGAANFGSDVLQQTLVDTFGTSLLSDLKTNVIIPSYELVNSSTEAGIFTLFSNVGGFPFTGAEETIVNVARATSGAPVYLPPAVFGGKTYLDGGIYNNNPAQLALNLAKTLKPTANRFCVLSVGTGIGQMEFYDDPDDHSLTPSEIGPFDTIKQIFGLMNIAMTGSQESTDAGLKLESDGALSNLFYYRFQPTLDPTKDTNLDNTKPEILEYYASVANTEFDADIDAINNFIGHLTA